MTKPFTYLILTATMLTTFGACSADDDVKDDTIYKDTLAVAVTPTLDCLPLFVAQEIGITKDQGHYLVLQGHFSKADCDTALAGGSVSAIFTDFGRADNLVANWKKLVAEKRGKKAKADSLTLIPHDNLHLYFFTNAKARIKEAKQLTDKMVAVDRKSAEAQMAQYVLDSVKLTSDKTFLVQMLNLRTRQTMLLNNTMDAAVLSEPQATIARKAGHKSVYSSGHHAKRAFGCIVASGKATLVKQLYNMACDSINKNGLHAYDSVLVRRCGVPAKIVSAIPNHKFEKVR